MSSVNVVNSIMSTLNIGNDSKANEPIRTIEPMAGMDLFENKFPVMITESLRLDLEDFHFKFASGMRIPAHKFLLSGGSMVFRAKFNDGEWKGLDEIEMNDVSAGAFKEFLQFFYTGSMKFTMKNVADVMSLSKIYNVADCTALCGKFLKTKLNYENILWAYELAIKNNAVELKRYCEMIIGLNTKAIFASENFKSCSRTVLANILESKLCCSEGDVFDACLEWLKNTIKVDKLTKELIVEHLGEFYPTFRFGLMKVNEIGQFNQKYGKFFTPEEYRKILGEFCEPRQKAVKPISWNPEDTIECERKLQGWAESRSNAFPMHLLKNIETTTFSSSAPLLLVALQPSFIYDYQKVSQNRQFTNFYNLEPTRCYQDELPSIKEDIPIEITIFEIDPLNATEKVVLQKEKAIFRNERKVMLSKLILIKPKFMYKIKMELTPPVNSAVNGYAEAKFELGKHTEINFHGEAMFDTRNGSGHNGYTSELIQKLQFVKINKEI